ncbi:MAG: molybdopterin-dependent oxidoreductase, partial [Burkholderiales bacterium]
MDIARPGAQHLPPGADAAHITYCRLCEAQCGLVAQVREGRIVKVEPDRAHVTSEGHLCVKGPGMRNVTYDPDRVLYPLRRTGAAGEFERVSWDDALDDIARRLDAIVERDGGQAAAIYGGNPASFGTLHFGYIRQFLAAIHSGRLFSPMHVDTGAKHLASELVFGHGFRYTFPDLERCDFLLMLGANPMVSHMSLIAEPRAHRKLEEIARRGAVVVVDPRRTETAKRFEHVQVQPDSDAWLLAAMLRTLFDEGLADVEYLEAHVDGWRDLNAALEAFDIETCARRCGVSADTLRTLARRFAGARTAACYGRLGTNRGRHATLTSFFIEALNLVAGRFAQAGGAVIGQAPFEHAAAPLMPPPYGSRRSRVGNLPLIGGMEPGGNLAAEILTPGEGQIKALIVDSGNPVLGYPQGERAAQAFESLELMVALDFYVTETSRHAHYILPTTTFFERDDVTDLWTINAPRPWLQAVPASIEPLGEARVEFDIYNALLKRMRRTPLFDALRPAGGPPLSLMQAADAMLRNG